MEKLFQSTTRGAKASDYKQDKNEAQQQKAKEVADAKAKGKGTEPKDKDSDKKSLEATNAGDAESLVQALRSSRSTTPHAKLRTRCAQGANAKVQHLHTAPARARALNTNPRRLRWSEILGTTGSRYHSMIAPPPTWRT